ncbi:MAG: hypothetical protein ABIP39_16745, partial [Polyangiaceae bacterium]
MRAGSKTWVTLLVGSLLGCSEDTFSAATDAANDATNDGTTIGDATPEDASDARSDATGCGDPMSDPKNCGGCAHSCLGGDCDAGTCM